MNTISNELLEKLIREDFEFRKAYELHSDCEKKIEVINKKNRLSADEEVEMNRLKKMKLIQKDKMEEMVSKYRG